MEVESTIETGGVTPAGENPDENSYVAPEIAAAQAGETVTFTMNPVSGDPVEE